MGYSLALLVCVLVGAPLSQAWAGEKARPLYYERKIEPADLEGRTLRELSIMRNTIFARQGRAFRVQWLNDYFNDQDWYEAGNYDPKKMSDVDKANVITIATYENEVPPAELKKRRDALSKANPKQSDWTLEELVEMRLISKALGDASGPDWFEAKLTPLEDPHLLDLLLDVKQLRDMSRRDLRILRNMIFARRGRPFKSEILQEYFGRMDWYEPDPKYTDDRLTDIDRKNIKVVLSVENELGGPLTEAEHAEAQHWMMGA